MRISFRERKRNSVEIFRSWVSIQKRTEGGRFDFGEDSFRDGAKRVVRVGGEAGVHGAGEPGGRHRRQVTGDLARAACALCHRADLGTDDCFFRKG